MEKMQNSGNSLLENVKKSINFDKLHDKVPRE